MIVKVTLVAHYEWAEDAVHGTWWADSPDVPGFFAAYPSLGELQREAEEAVRWSLDDEVVEVDWTTEDDAPEWASVHVALTGPTIAGTYGTSAGQTFFLGGSVEKVHVALPAVKDLNLTLPR